MTNRFREMAHPSFTHLVKFVGFVSKHKNNDNDDDDDDCTNTGGNKNNNSQTLLSGHSLRHLPQLVGVVHVRAPVARQMDRAVAVIKSGLFGQV